MDKSASTSRAKLVPQISGYQLRHAVSSPSHKIKSRVRTSLFKPKTPRCGRVKTPKNPKPPKSSRKSPSFLTAKRCQSTVGHHQLKKHPHLENTSSRVNKTVSKTYDEAFPYSRDGETAAGAPDTSSDAPSQPQTNDSLMCMAGSLARSEISRPTVPSSVGSPEIPTSEQYSSSQYMSKNPSESQVLTAIQTAPIDDLANTSLGRPGPSLSIEEYLRMREMKIKRMKFGARSPRRRRNGHLAADRPTAKCFQSELFRDALMNQQRCSDSYRRMHLEDNFSCKEYMQDVGVLAELVKKATLDFFKDANAVKFALEERPDLRSERTKIQTTKRNGGKKSTHRLTPRPPKRLRPRRVVSKSFRASHMQFSSSTSEIGLYQLACGSHGRKKRRIPCERKFDQALMRKERTTLLKKNKRDTQDRRQFGCGKFPNVGAGSDNVRVCTSIELSSGRHSTRIRSKQSIIERVEKEAPPVSTSSNEDTSGLKAIFAESRRTTTEKESEKEMKNNYNRSCVHAQSNKLSKLPCCSQSCSSQCDRKNARDGASKAMRPQSLPLCGCVVQKSTDANYAPSDYSKNTTSTKSTQTLKNDMTNVEALNLSQATGSEDTFSEWNDISAQTTAKSSTIPEKLQISNKVVQATGHQHTNATHEDLPTYLDPSEAWSFYNSSKIRLPYMEIDGIFDGTPFSVKKTPPIKQVNTKSIQVNVQRPAEANSRGTDSPMWELLHDQQLKKQAVAPTVTDNVIKIEKECYSVRANPKLCQSTKDAVFSKTYSEPIKIDLEDQKSDLVNSDHKSSESSQDATICGTSSFEHTNNQSSHILKSDSKTCNSIQDMVCGKMSYECIDTLNDRHQKKIPNKRRSKVCQLVRKSTKHIGSTYNRSSKSLVIDDDLNTPLPLATKKYRSSAEGLSSKCTLSDKSSLQNLPGYARPTSTSFRRLQETKIQLEVLRQTEGTPSRYMALPHRKSVQWPDKRRSRVLCSRRQSGILVKGSNSRLGCSLCKRRQGGFSDVDLSSKSSPSCIRLAGKSSKKSISFSLQNSDGDEKCDIRAEAAKDPSLLESNKINGDVCEATKNRFCIKQSGHEQMPFFKKWLSSVNQIVNPLKKMILRPSMVSVSCSNTNLIRLPNLLLKDRDSPTKPKHWTLGTKTGFHV